MEITITELTSILNKNLETTSENPWKLGRNYFIRTVTHHLTGKLVAVHVQELVLERAAWIADDGRLTDALKTETFNEVEVFPSDRPVIVGRSSVIDACELNALPTSQK